MLAKCLGAKMKKILHGEEENGEQSGLLLYSMKPASAAFELEQNVCGAFIKRKKGKTKVQFCAVAYQSRIRRDKKKKQKTSEL